MIRNRLWITTLCLVYSFSWSCSPKVSDQVTNTEEISMEEKINTLAVQHFESGYKIAYNTSKTHALISKSIKTRKNEAFATLALLIYDGKSETIIFQETIPKASAKWISDHEVEVQVVTGMLADDQQADAGFIFNVQEKRRMAR